MNIDDLRREVGGAAFDFLLKRSKVLRARLKKNNEDGPTKTLPELKELKRNDTYFKEDDVSESVLPEGFQFLSEKEEDTTLPPSMLKHFEKSSNLSIDFPVLNEGKEALDDSKEAENNEDASLPERLEKSSNLSINFTILDEAKEASDDSRSLNSSKFYIEDTSNDDYSIDSIKELARNTSPKKSKKKKKATPLKKQLSRIQEEDEETVKE